MPIGIFSGFPKYLLCFSLVTGLADVRRALLSGAPFGHHLKEVGSPLTPPSSRRGLWPWRLADLRLHSSVLRPPSPKAFPVPQTSPASDTVQCGPTASAMEAGRRPARCAEERSPAQKCEYERASEQTRLSHLTALFPGYVTLAVLDDSIIAPVALSETSSRARPRAHPSAIPINVGAEMHRAQASEWYVCLGVGPRAFALRVGIPFEQVEVRVDGARDPGEGRELRSGER
ncbi:hypothetical protein B0H17DRAFT_1333787 [Mycena rosella]|uniref:Uncharacterized protein n=1 Tax=Mycena rosella TaxID=1033263 RepID=A0AAD7G9Q0_MYCRO|nr:hypothetical protein B0H17DRAFT_1333787 [Mycena rosella]